MPSQESFDASLARRLHRVMNSAFWVENPKWEANNAPARIACKAVRKLLPFSLHDLSKTAFLTNQEAIVNGESIVVPDGDFVNKYMCRRPPYLSLEQFEVGVREEISAVIHHLGGIALATEVSIQDADIFRWPLQSVKAVTQRQKRLDLDEYPALTNEMLTNGKTSEQTARHLEQMLRGIEQLAEVEGLYPDLGESTGNLRVSKEGNLILIDVMPTYESGGRLINDGARALPSTLARIALFQEHVGSFGIGR